MHRLTVIVAAILVIAAAATALAQAGRRGDLVDANTASDKQLRAIPGLTPALVAGIQDRRPFAAPTDLDALLSPSLSREQRMEIYRRLFVQINLNTAADAEILLIPGVDDRRLDEFKESRPYTALAQFRRQIGKAVDAREVARLEQYVFVPINLNTASDAEILSIPGVGQRMLTEFKEYRPYKAMPQFRREIGKYVNEKEVARLERYVTVN